MNCTFEEFLLKTFGFKSCIAEGPLCQKEEEEEKREVNAVLTLGF